MCVIYKNVAKLCVLSLAYTPFAISTKSGKIDIGTGAGYPAAHYPLHVATISLHNCSNILQDQQAHIQMFPRPCYPNKEWTDFVIFVFHFILATPRTQVVYT